MARLNFFLSLEEPQVDFARARQDVVSCAIEKNRGQTIFWSITDLVKNSLDASISTDVPNLDYFIGP